MAVHNQNLINCLTAALSHEAQTRNTAEATLEENSKHAGFGLQILSIARAAEVPFGIRQLACVILRQYVQNYWSPDIYDEKSIISDEEKAQIRENLPAGLADSDRRMQIAMSMITAEIAKTDCPDTWPQLLPGLVQYITNAQDNSLAAVSGGVICLGMLMEDLSGSQVVGISQVVLPHVLSLARSPQCPSSLRRHSLKIFKSSLESIEMLYKSDANAQQLLDSCIPQWFEAIAGILSMPITGQDAHEWGVKFDALGCLIKAVPPFGKSLVKYMPPIMQATWSMVVSTLPLYYIVEVQGNDEDVSHDGIDPGDEPLDLCDLISQLFEFVLTLVSSNRYAKLMAQSFEELAYLTLGYMEMRDEDAVRWQTDLNLFLQEDELFWGPRASGEMLLDELVEAHGMNAVAAAFERKAKDAAAAKTAGNTEQWWRCREAVLLGLIAVSDRISDMKRRHLKGDNRKVMEMLPAALDPEVVLHSVLHEDLVHRGAGLAPSPYVASRALTLVSKWASCVSPALQSIALRSSASYLSPGNPGMIQLGACRALGMLCKSAPHHDVKAVSDHALNALCSLIQAANEDALHLVIESITSFIKADPECAARYEHHITPPLLHTWINNINAPFLEEDAREALRALADIPECLPALQSRMLPTLSDIISHPHQHSTILVSSCLDMIVALLTVPPYDAAPAICVAAFAPALQLVLTSDDDDVLASGTALLRTVLQVGGDASLTWLGQDAPTTVASYLKALQRLLGAGVSDRGCRYAGGLVMELLRHASALLLPLLPGLMTAIAARLTVADDPATVQSLLGVVAFLAKHDAHRFVDLLASAPGPGGVSALNAVMQKWIERQIEIRTAYDIRLTTAALGALLMCPHQELDAIMVRGKRTDTAGAIRTRSLAKAQAEQWSSIPLRVKIVMLLSDAYIEAETQKSVNGHDGDGSDDFDEEEWTDEDDYDDDDDDQSQGILGALLGMDQFDGGFEFDEEDLELSNVDQMEASRRKDDPLSAMDVGEYVAEMFRALSSTAPQLLQQAAGELTPTQVQAVQKIWKM